MIRPDPDREWSGDVLYAPQRRVYFAGDKELFAPCESVAEARE